MPSEKSITTAGMRIYAEVPQHIMSLGDSNVKVMTVTTQIIRVMMPAATTQHCDSGDT